MRFLYLIYVSTCMRLIFRIILNKYEYFSSTYVIIFKVHLTRSFYVFYFHEGKQIYLSQLLYMYLNSIQTKRVSIKSYLLQFYANKQVQTMNFYVFQFHANQETRMRQLLDAHK